VIAVSSVDEFDFGRSQVRRRPYNIEFLELDACLARRPEI
jgi:hypothetical protein